MGWACPSSGGHLPREGLEQEGEAAVRTDSRILSAPPAPRTYRGRAEPQPVWWKGHPPHRDRASSGVASRRQSAVLQDTDVPPSFPRSCSGEGRGAGRQSCAGWRGGGGPSPPSHSSALCQKCSSWTVVGALLLLLSSSSSPSWGFYKTDKGTALGVRRQGLHPAEYLPALASGIQGEDQSPRHSASPTEQGRGQGLRSHTVLPRHTHHHDRSKGGAKRSAFQDTTASRDHLTVSATELRSPSSPSDSLAPPGWTPTCLCKGPGLPPPQEC